MTDSCVYILGQSRSRGGLAREARQGAASREKAKVANLIKYTETKTETNARYKAEIMTPKSCKFKKQFARTSNTSTYCLVLEQKNIHVAAQLTK